MSDWAYNRIDCARRDDFNKVCRVLVNGDGYVDFNKIAQRPEELEIDALGEETECACIAQYLFGYLDEHDEATVLEEIHKHFPEKGEIQIDPDVLDLIANPPAVSYAEEDEGRRYLHNLVTYGYLEWRPWSIANWGVKWNASGSIVDLDQMTLRWDTAWSPSTQIVEEVAARSGATFLYACADDRMNSSAGELLVRDGKPMERQQYHGIEAYRIYVRLMGEPGEGRRPLYRYGATETEISRRFESLLSDDETWRL